MRCCFIGFLLIVVCSWSQTTTTGNASTKGSCSPANSGSNNNFNITCPGIGLDQGQKIIAILNKIIDNQLDPQLVMQKLDEILKSVNPNLPSKTYFCNGQWRTAGPGTNAGFEISLGGDDSAAKEMANLADSRQYPALLTECLAQIQSAPEWLTPRLFCGLAYLGEGDKAKARDMLDEYESRKGPAYEQPLCQKISGYLRQNLP